MTAAIGHDAGVQRLLEARHHDPFEVLGAHPTGAGQRIRIHLPRAREVHLVNPSVTLERVGDTDLFEVTVSDESLVRPWVVAWVDDDGASHEHVDAYAFGPQLAQSALSDFSAGNHRRAHELLGARLHEVDGIVGVLFAVWAPGAERVSVVGNFNHWDGRLHPMRSRGESGVFELFVPGVDAGTLYKFELRVGGGNVVLKTDPYGRAFERRPATGARVVGASGFEWGDSAWMGARPDTDWQRRPMSVYEVHLGSWRRADDGDFLDYRSIADRLVPWLDTLGFTHVELMPVTEHPLDASWGYQCTGFFAPTSRFGDEDDFRYLVDLCHQAGIGVLLDWVPGHFPRDQHALARFDGTALYEHADSRRAEHPDWGTLTFNYARHEVRSFLLSSACYWLEDFHIDGLRVDAVASMLYLDYSRQPGQWLPNRYGGRENLEAIDFLRELNECVHGEFPGAVVIAEESTAWPQVTRPTWLGGLGFSMKWSMGWMHDTLEYLGLDPIYRKYHQDRLTFGMTYSHTENFMLPFSHDEVVHGKGSMIARMPGDYWQRFANLRGLYAYQFTYPGKKLQFMGCELAAWREWDENAELDWSLADQTAHAGIVRLVGDLNGLYRDVPALFERDFDAEGFEWIDCHDATQSVLSYLRWSLDGHYVVVVINFTPIPRHGYRLGVPSAGRHLERLNTDAADYGGSGLGNLGAVEATPTPWMGRPCSIEVTLPPLAAVIFQPG